MHCMFLSQTACSLLVPFKHSESFGELSVLSSNVSDAAVNAECKLVAMMYYPQGKFKAANQNLNKLKSQTSKETTLV